MDNHTGSPSSARSSYRKRVGGFLVFVVGLKAEFEFRAREKLAAEFHIAIGVVEDQKAGLLQSLFQRELHPDRNVLYVGQPWPDLYGVPRQVEYGMHEIAPDRR